MTGLDAEAVGKLSVQMGAGRQAKTDTIDPAVGIELHAKTGDRVQTNAPLATLHVRHAERERVEEWADLLATAYTFGAMADPMPPSLVLEVIE